MGAEALLNGIRVSISIFSMALHQLSISSYLVTWRTSSFGDDMIVRRLMSTKSEL